MRNLLDRAGFTRRIKRRKHRKRKNSRTAKTNSGVQKILSLNSSYKWLLRGMLLLLILGLLVAIVSAIRAYSSIDFEGETTWDGDQNLNLLIVGLDEKEGGYKFIDAIVLVRISPGDDEVGILGVDPDIRFVHEGESISLQKSYNVGDEEGMELLEEGINKSLALKVDKYIVIDEESFVELSKLFSSVDLSFDEDKTENDFEEYPSGFTALEGRHSYHSRELLAALAVDEFGIDKRLSSQVITVESFADDLAGLPFLYRFFRDPSLINKVETNLSKSEALDLFMFLRKGSRLTMRSSYTAQNSLILADAEKVEKEVLWERVSQDIQAVFLDERILQEQVRLEVLNGTEVPGLAGRYKRNFENSGLRVVREGNSIRPASDTRLYLGEFADKEYTIEFIKSMFDDKIEVKEETYKYKHIGDMVLVLGEDLSE
ncbi:hypothetical protein GF389_05205 [Candidatus Dojkabacteria bacterium]|nr:hypothetical protein [Candidatus Dojkabacteria bacterium]